VHFFATIHNYLTENTGAPELLGINTNGPYHLIFLFKRYHIFLSYAMKFNLN